MSLEFPNIQFNASRKKYRFIAYLEETSTYQTLNIAADKVLLFQYENELNKLYPIGELIYVDTVGKIVNYINKCNVILNASLTELTLISDNKSSFELEDEDDRKRLDLKFLVTNVEILSRDNSNITYKFYLVGINYMLLNCPIEYSTYNDKKQPITLIIKLCLLNNDQSGNTIVIGDTFNKIKDETSIHYAAKCNDTTITSIRYLLSKLYYFDIISSSLKFIYYNNLTSYRSSQKSRYGSYEILDLKTAFDSSENSNTLGAYDIIILSMFKTSEEYFVYDKANNLGSVVKMPKTIAYDAIRGRNILNYSYSNNNFLSTYSEASAIAHYANERSETIRSSTKDKFEPFNYNSTAFDIFNNHRFTPKTNKTEIFWNNTYDVYDSLVSELTQDNALIVYTNGNICRIPGSILQISIPPDATNAASNLMTSSSITYEDDDNRYRLLGGLWIVSKVRHIISPTEGKYELSLTLFKNYQEKESVAYVDNTSNLNGQNNSLYSNISKTMIA